MKKLKIGILALCACAASAAALAFSACAKEEPAHVHSYGEWQTVVAATCEEGGSERRECTGCDASAEGHFETRQTDPTGHDWDDGVEAPPATCAATGTLKITCRNNPSHTKYQAIPKISHQYGEWVINVPGYDHAGKAVKTCANCTEEALGHKVEIDLPALDDEDYTVTDDTATCLAGGTAKFSITIGEETFSFETETRATGVHLSGKWDDLNGRKPGDLVAISVNKICDKCHQVMDTQVLGGLNSSNVKKGEYTYQEVNPATCSSKGLAKYTTNYEKLIADNVYYTFEMDIPMLPHAYKFESEPQTGSSGTAKIVCGNNCGFEQSVEYGDYLTAGGAAQNSPVKVTSKKYLMKVTENGSNFFGYDLTENESCVIKVTITPIANGLVQTDENLAALIGKDGSVSTRGEWTLEDSGRYFVRSYSFFECTPKKNTRIEPEAALKDFTVTIADGPDIVKSMYVFNLIAKNASEETPAFFTVDVEYSLNPIKYGHAGNYIGFSEAKSTLAGFKRNEGDPEYFQFDIGASDLNKVETLKVTLDKKDGSEGTVIYDNAAGNTEGKFEIHDTEMHTVLFEVGKQPSMLANYEHAITISFLESNASGIVPDENLRPDHTVSISVGGRGGTATVEISNVAEPGWYKIYPKWSNNLGQAQLSVKVNDGPVKNLFYGAAASNSKEQSDHFAIVAYLKPGDILTYTNPGFNSYVLVLNMAAHEHDNLAFTVTKPTADATGKASRNCGGVKEEIVLPVLGDQNYTVEGNKYTIVINGVTITFTV